MAYAGFGSGPVEVRQLSSQLALAGERAGRIVAKTCDRRHATEGSVSYVLDAVVTQVVRARCAPRGGRVPAQSRLCLAYLGCGRRAEAGRVETSNGSVFLKQKPGNPIPYLTLSPCCDAAARSEDVPDPVQDRWRNIGCDAAFGIAGKGGSERAETLFGALQLGFERGVLVSGRYVCVSERDSLLTVAQELPLQRRDLRLDLGDLPVAHDPRHRSVVVEALQLVTLSCQDAAEMIPGPVVIGKHASRPFVRALESRQSAARRGSPLGKRLSFVQERPKFRRTEQRMARARRSETDRRGQLPSDGQRGGVGAVAMKGVAEQADGLLDRIIRMQVAARRPGG